MSNSKVRGPGEEFGAKSRADEDDVEGHRRAPDAATKSRAPEAASKSREVGDEDDVEGHGIKSRTSGE